MRDSPWWLLFNPDTTIALARKTHVEACDTLGAIHKIFDNQNIRDLFTMAHGKPPSYTQDRAVRMAFDFKTSVTKEGSIDVYGVSSSMTGTHYDKIILDDVVTLKDRLSRAIREQTKEFMRETITNIIKPDGQVIHTGTPWHKEDAWSISPQPIQKYSYHVTGILTPEQIADKKSRTTPSLWAANYELEHQADDRALFQNPRFGSWQNSPMKAVAHLDAAFGGDHFSGFTIARRIDSFAKDIQMRGWAWGGHIKHHYIEIVHACRDHKADILYIETNADKGFVAEAIREVARAMGYDLTVKEYSERTNKGVKIATILSHYWPEIIWDSETHDEYMGQIVDWQEGAEPDDAPDSAASLLREHFGGPNGTDPFFMYR